MTELSQDDVEVLKRVYFFANDLQSIVVITRLNEVGSTEDEFIAELNTAVRELWLDFWRKNDGGGIHVFLWGFEYTIESTVKHEQFGDLAVNVMRKLYALMTKFLPAIRNKRYIQDEMRSYIVEITKKFASDDRGEDLLGSHLVASIMTHLYIGEHE